METLKVLVVDDHALFREGIVGIINGQPDLSIVGEASDGLEAVVMARDLRPDVVLMDITMPGMDGIEAARLIKRERDETRIIMLTVRDEDDKLFDAIKAGADGYLLKTIRAQQLIEMLRAAQRGEPAVTPQLAARIMGEFRRVARGTVAAGVDSAGPLTAREREVLDLIADGASDKEIAQQLTVSLYTVKAHVRSVLHKLHVTSRHDAARQARPGD